MSHSRGGWAGLLLAGMVLSCRGNGGSAEGPPRPAFDPGPVPVEHVAGAELFRANCTGCHGPAGSGFTGGPPLLDTLYLLPRFADSAVRRAVLAGAPSHNWDFDDMPAVRTVRPDQIAAVTAYLRWVQRRWVAGLDSASAGPAAPAGGSGPAAAPAGSPPKPRAAARAPGARPD
ncbi:MAG TPA: cytochrome c [Gemmatimonadales bacterium]|nr:cytochrome c [Gemmatimonadales bacterium]